MLAVASLPVSIVAHEVYAAVDRAGAETDRLARSG